MPQGDPPVTVAELIARATTVTGNIAKHRAAMAEVAAAVKGQQQASAVKGVTSQ